MTDEQFDALLSLIDTIIILRIQPHRLDPVQIDHRLRDARAILTAKTPPPSLPDDDL